MTAPQGPVSIHFGPGDPIPVTAIGTIAFTFNPIKGSSTTQPTTVCVHDVYYVPQQHMNLLSVHTLNTHSAGANFDQKPGYVRFSTPTGDCYKTFQWENNLPYIPVSNIGSIPSLGVECYAIRRAVPKELQGHALHSRFGHVGSAKLRKLVSAGYLDNSAVNDTKDLDCDHCLTGNAQREPYPTIDYQAKYPNHVFHADVLYMPERTLDGKEYALVVVDEHTRYVFVSLLSSRSKAGDQMLVILRRAQTLQDKCVKFIHTDLGGEFHSRIMQVAKDELGISDQHIPAECHASNGIVERVNRTLQSMVRAMLQASKFPLSFWGEFLLAAVHVYNLLPHKALSGQTSEIPRQLYLGETQDRLERLYHQLVPIGIQ
jgi:transposase InsO family protein